MSLKFTAYTSSGDPVEMELLRDGTITVLSPDMEYELAFKAMGGNSEVIDCYEDMTRVPMRAFDHPGLPKSKFIAILVEVMRDYISRFWTGEVILVVADIVEYPPTAKSDILDILDAILDIKPDGNDIKSEWLDMLRKHAEKNADRLASRRTMTSDRRTSDIVGSTMRFYDSLATLYIAAKRHGSRMADDKIFLETTSFSQVCAQVATAAALIVTKSTYADYAAEDRRQVGIAFRVLGME